jgi:peptidyl-prolyl cis-trans isomerase SurA
MVNKFATYMRFCVFIIALSGAACSSGMAVLMSFSRAVIAETNGIAAVVNDDVVTKTDLDKRVRLVIASSGLPDTREIRQKFVRQVLGNLINEQLMLQEAKKYGLAVDQKEIDNGFEQIAQQNNMSRDQFKAMLRKVSDDTSSITRQIEAQLAWGKVVQARLRSRVVISERDIDDALERIRGKIGTTEYLVAEIYLPIEDVTKEQQVQKLASGLVQEIRSGKASFFKLAQQFSRAAGATGGGDKGWVNEAQLPEELLQVLKVAGKDKVTDPIKTINGYHIMLLRDSRTLSEDTVPSREQIEYSIGTERMDRLQRQRLMDLRLASFIDIRT